MIKDLIGFFGAKMGDRRHHPRKIEQFHAAWVVDAQHSLAVIGGNVSAGGALIYAPAVTPPKELNVVMQLGERRVGVRMSVAWSGSFEREGKPWQALGCKYNGLSADDWDFIVRHVTGVAETADKLSSELAQLAAHPDDAFRLVPAAIQKQIVDALVAIRRVDYPGEGATPLMKMDYGGVQAQADGKKIYRLNVHSRVNSDDVVTAFDSQFTLEEGGELKFVH